MSDKNIVLLRYTVLLRPDGQLQSIVDNVDPDEFLKQVDTIDKTWEDAPKIAQGLKFLLKQLEVLDNDFDKHLMSL